MTIGDYSHSALFCEVSGAHAPSSPKILPASMGSELSPHLCLHASGCQSLGMGDEGHWKEIAGRNLLG